MSCRCKCHFQEGAGVDITGSGSLADPFVITADIGEITNAVQSVDFMRDGVAVAGSGVMRWYAPVAMTIVAVRASVGVAPTGASLIADVNKNGTTVFTTQANRPTIAAAGFTNLTVAPNVTALAVGDYLTVDIDQIGSVVAGESLNVQVFVRPA